MMVCGGNEFETGLIVNLHISEFNIVTIRCTSDTITEGLLWDDDDYPVYVRLKRIHHEHEGWITTMSFVSYWYEIAMTYDYGWPWTYNGLANNLVTLHRGFMLNIAPMAAGDWNESFFKETINHINNDEVKITLTTLKVWKKLLKTIPERAKSMLRTFKLEEV